MQGINDEMNSTCLLGEMGGVLLLSQELCQNNFPWINLVPYNLIAILMPLHAKLTHLQGKITLHGASTLHFIDYILRANGENFTPINNKGMTRVIQAPPKHKEVV